MNPVELLQELEIAAHSTENYLAPDQYYALQNMSYCRTIEKGGRITHCPACKTNTILYNPCNQRGCPQCYKKNQIQWSNKLKSKLLPTGHYHLVFSLPQHLTYIWLMDKANFINSFFHSVQQAFKKLRKETGLILGVTMAFQSHGQGLCYKPHVHCIVTNHGINEKKEWVACGAISYNLLRDTVKELLIPHLNKKLDPIKKGIAETPFALCEDREWTVFPSIHKYNADKIVNYLSKSVSGVVIDTEKGLEINHTDNTVTITENHLGKERETTLDRPTFRDRYLNHIPPKGTVTIRNYGLYSNRFSDLLKEIKENILKAESAEPEPDPSFEEECRECYETLITKETFSCSDYPLILRLHLLKNNDPPGHGYSFKTA